MHLGESVLNLASAALNIRDKGKTISYESFVLSIVYLAICLFGITLVFFGLIKIERARTKYIQFIRMWLIFSIILNITYSALVIQSYNSKSIIDEQFYNLSIAIVAIDGIGILM